MSIRESILLFEYCEVDAKSLTIAEIEHICEAIIKQKESVKSVADLFCLNQRTLRNYVSRYKAGDSVRGKGGRPKSFNEMADELILDIISKHDYNITREQLLQEFKKAAEPYPDINTNVSPATFKKLMIKNGLKV